MTTDIKDLSANVEKQKVRNKTLLIGFRIEIPRGKLWGIKPEEIKKQKVFNLSFIKKLQVIDIFYKIFLF